MLAAVDELQGSLYVIKTWLPAVRVLVQIECLMNLLKLSCVPSYGVGDITGIAQVTNPLYINMPQYCYCYIECIQGQECLLQIGPLD